MKNTYVYFGKRGYYQIAPGTDEATPALTNAAAGLVPSDQAVDQADGTHDIEVFIQTVNNQGSGTRGTGFGTVDVNGKTIVSADPAVGDVVRIIDTAFTVSSGVITIEDAASDDTTNGYTMHASDILHVKQKKASAKCPPFEARSGGAAYPMSNFLGAQPVAYDLVYTDLSALDQTDLHFKSTIGDNTSDIVRIIHAAGKYPEICKLMERLANCGVYDKAVTVYDFDTNGNETFLSPTMGNDNSLGIVGVWHVPSA
tara:strand:+ start:3513 stop:4280 length:768 start_codon:yes stop_codon:yes gene_type:complete